ncbi:MAG: amidohydrolase [Lachnospiraceae bacterium]|nr:amidohydrolase [Lachnospiraceae bacterium]MCI6409076.1 amidohydrolase [Lachnospiraceae bacterium]MCI6977889.1 amidohydrolase [Lachnospiraceae bacterium]MDD6580302.1 amidohydrolase [Lachnospiraceae bacterium]MDY4428340.1 amidohydrolase [Lachnospiraceae bacterium]
MNLRFYNARILTMEEEKGKDCDLREIFFGEVHVKDSKISYVGKETNTALKFDREIDCKGNLLMPGFKNAHTHSGMTAMRSYADGLPLKEWLETKIFPMEANMSGDDVKLLSKLAIMEYLTSGITAAMDMYLTPYTIADAFTECGMRIVQVSGINKFGPSIEEFEERFLKINGKNPLSTQLMGFHAEYTCDKELLTKLSDLAHKYKQPMYTHNSETKVEFDECVGRYGVSPTVFLDSLGLFDFGGGGYHCVYLTDEDIEIFKKHDMSVISNPGSNTKLASGIAPIQKFIDSGLNVALGTDGPSSNNCLDMFREMFLVTGLAKLRENNASAVDALTVLKMATKNGAKAMLLDDCDVLAKGKQADMIMIDLCKPNMQPLNDIARNIVFSGSKQNVKMTMVAGKILYEDGKYNIGIDEETVYKEANDIITRLKAIS